MCVSGVEIAFFSLFSEGGGVPFFPVMGRPGLGITTMEGANRYLEEVYRVTFNAEFLHPATEEGNAFVPWKGIALKDVLCEQFERTVGNDNCIRFEGKILQIPNDKYRNHYVRAKVGIHWYQDRSLAIFYGPRQLAHYTADGQLEVPDTKVIV